MSKQLPAHPNLEQLKKQAKAVLKGHHAATPEFLQRIREQHPRWRDAADETIAKAHFTLGDAQLVIAREYGFATWPKLKAHIIQATSSTEDVVKSIHDAAGRGDLAQLKSLLEKHPTLINETGGPGVRTALHRAVFGGQLDTLDFLLEKGADPNIRCEGDNAFPLHFAAEKQNLPMIRALIEHGAESIGEGDYHELGVLGWATAWDYVNENREVADYLLAHGARHNIFSAVAMGEAGVIRELVASTPNDLERRMNGTRMRRMPLHLAVVKHRPESLKVLLDLGANLESLDESFFTALDQAALIGEMEMARMLLERGAKVRLPAAFALQRTADIEKLLRKDPDSLQPRGRWGNLIVRASERSPGWVVEALLAAGADVNVRDNPKTAVDNTSGYTPLHAAAFNGNLSAIPVLLSHGANVTTREEKYHVTPAGWANHNGHTEARDLILRGPVDIMEAVENELEDRTAAILRDDPEALNRRFDQYPLYPLYAEGWYTPLVFAVVLGKTKIVRWLLDHGAEAPLQSPDGRSLHDLAKQKGHAEIAEMVGSGQI